MAERASEPSWRLNKPRPFKIARRGLDKLKQRLTKNSESCDNGRVHPDMLGLPVPAPPPATSATTNFHTASFPTPTPPPSQGWWTPGQPGQPGQHDQEASGSNHTSKQNSEYFDAVDTSEYLNQHQIPNHAELRGRHGNRQPRLEDQLAYCLQDIQVGTPPTSHDQTYDRGNPFAQAFNPDLDLLSASYCDPVNEHYSFLAFDDTTATSAPQQHGQGTMESSWFPGCEDATGTSAQQQYGHGTTDPSWFRGSEAATVTLAQQQHGHGHGSMSMATGDSVDSGCSTMDTGTSSPPTSPSSYIFQPVAEGRPSSIRRTFYSYYMEYRRIVRGEETPDGSGRRGRGFRVLGSIICIAIRLKGRLASRTKSQQQSTAEEEIREPLREQGTKKKRTGGCTASSSGSTEQRKYKSVAQRNGKWHAEVRVSKVCGSKVWAGTYGTQEEAALAADAGYYHCSAKKKKYNFPGLVKDLGPSQYNHVLALFESDQKHTAQELVKTLMKAHAAKLSPQNSHYK